LPKDQRLGASTGTENKVLERGSKGAQFMAAEKGGEGRREKSSREQTIPKSLNKTLWNHGNKDASKLIPENSMGVALFRTSYLESQKFKQNFRYHGYYPKLFINMIFVTGFNALRTGIRDMCRFSEISYVSLDCKIKNE
jgi:hypothetical protein